MLRDIMSASSRASSTYLEGVRSTTNNPEVSCLVYYVVIFLSSGYFVR